MGIVRVGEWFRFNTALVDRKCTRTALTDAQIKALPTTGVSIVPAHGAGKIIVPKFAITVINATAGAYTNVNAAGFINFHVNAVDLLAFIANDAGLTNPAADLTALLTNAAINIALSGPLLQPDAAASAWYTLAKVHTPTSTLANQPLTIKADNNAAGNFTGGHASNSGYVITEYLVI